MGYDCFVHSGARIAESIVLSGCDIGHDARLCRVILDKNCKIEPGCIVGEDLAGDMQRFPFVTESGIVVIPKGTIVPAHGPCVLANDVAELLEHDPDIKPTPGTFVKATQSRHSYESAGPRFKKFAGDPH
jgi:glucose-1-phosphate adenylyltransferase